MPTIFTKVRDLLSFLAGLAIVYHETVIVDAAVGPRIDLLVVAALLLGIAPAAITNRWLGGSVEITPTPNAETETTPTDPPKEP